MYSWEIENELKRYNYNLPAKLYASMFSVANSPQVSKIKYDVGEDVFTVWTDDGYCWRFRVYN